MVRGERGGFLAEATYEEVPVEAYEKTDAGTGAGQGVGRDVCFLWMSLGTRGVEEGVWCGLRM